MNDLYSLDLNSTTWSQPQTTGATPSPRFGHSVTLLPAVRKVVVLGGTDGKLLDPHAATDPEFPPHKSARSFCGMAVHMLDLDTLTCARAAAPLAPSVPARLPPPLAPCAPAAPPLRALHNPPACAPPCSRRAPPLPPPAIDASRPPRARRGASPPPSPRRGTPWRVAPRGDDAPCALALGGRVAAGRR